MAKTQLTAKSQQIDDNKRGKKYKIKMHLQLSWREMCQLSAKEELLSSKEIYS